MKKKIKWNYAVMKSIFNDLWIGKTKLKADEQFIFANIADAINHAQQTFEDYHPGFDPYDKQLFQRFEEFAEYDEYNVEEIKKNIEKYIVRN